MSRAVFVDASAWIAITNRRDDYHFVAQELYRELLAEKTPLFTTTWVAYEALSLIKSRMGYKKTLELWEVLNNQRLVKLVRVSRIMEEAGLKIFFDYQDKTWGVVDCISIATMRLLNCRRAFAFDEHFCEAGRQSGLEILP
ncbi:type II toxin-antitoxin system VapC family toxin [Neomoorella thermoacetica]|uniref:Ribonuclease VapC20 n=1 Tax=Neomoorella thermoacetica TaxID=1525 RepID=A0A1J5JFW3_NEOTH|nr:PIN domain-containing protein [Moorella thermoacetica]OIQ08406.1 ribonuclease VapC20 [Moorella thermoacetica]